jgi:hypothetical protein
MNTSKYSATVQITFTVFRALTSESAHMKLLLVSIKWPVLSARFWCNSPQWARASSFTSFLNHTQRRTTVGMTPLYEWSARRRDLYPIAHNKHNRHTSIPPVGFEPTISAGDRAQTYALDCAAAGTDDRCCRNANKRKLRRTNRVDERGTNHYLLRTSCTNKTQQSWSRHSIRRQVYSQDRRNV